MPSLDLYRKLNGGVHSCGEQRFREASSIVEATWFDDSHATVGYLYDYYHDEFKNKLNELEPQDDNNKVPINLKFIVNSSQSFGNDNISYHIQLMPSQKCNVDYYDTFFKNRYSTTFPIGLYVDLPDANGVYNKWLVVTGANINDPQFPTYEVLRCDYVLQYIHNHVKYEVSAVLRSQNS